MILEIFFNDLNQEAQDRYLDFYGLENAEDGNLDLDIVPLFVEERPDHDDIDQDGLDNLLNRSWPW